VGTFLNFYGKGRRCQKEFLWEDEGHTHGYLPSKMVFLKQSCFL